MLTDIILSIFNILNGIYFMITLTILYTDQIKPRLNKVLNILFLLSTFTILSLSIYFKPKLCYQISIIIIHIFQTFIIIYTILYFKSRFTNIKTCKFEELNCINNVSDDNNITKTNEKNLKIY